ncbi:hypothetical protein GF407_16365 [candidate division KSB1 bacterium]|nr:hypothetical protein [candidate division KSB1 bacterium]
MINNKSKRQILERILSSSEFAHSDINQKLLTYLVEKSIKGEIPKETTIAIDVFDKDAAFNPHEDTLVRVHIYKLREKLEKYYLSDGRDDLVRLCIPKGHYAVKFLPLTKKSGSAKKLRLTLYGLLSVLLVLFILVLTLYIHNTRLQSRIDEFAIVDKDDPIWHRLIGPYMPTLIVPGNNFFFAMQSGLVNETIIARYTEINSVNDFNQFVKSRPQLSDSIWVGDYAFLGKESAWSLNHLLPIFFSAHKSVELVISSQLSWDDFQKYHIVYIGSYKSLGLLNTLLTNLDFSYTLYPHQVVIKSDEGEANKVYQPEMVRDENYNKDYNRDYALIAKLPGPANNDILIIAGFYFIGVYEATKHISEPDLLSILKESLQRRHGKVPEYFEILLEISGYGRTGFSTTLIYSKEIQSNNKIEWEK